MANDADIATLKQDALNRARAAASEQGRKPTLEDYWGIAQQTLQLRGNDRMIADLRGLTLDGFNISSAATQHATAAFYDNLNFKNAILNHCLIDPAASFNTQLQDAAQISHSTFNDHREGNTFTLGHGRYEDITLTHFQGGTVVLTGSQVHRLNMEDQRITKLDLRHGTHIDGLSARNAHIVRIDADPGTSIAHANFRGATISMAGHMHGIHLTQVDFTGANLRDVSLQDARLSHVTLPADPQALKGLNLRGATLSDVRLENGQRVTSPAQLSALGVQVDDHTRIATGRSTAQRVANVNPVQQAVAGINLSALGLTGGTPTDLSQASPGQAVAGMDRPQNPDKSGDVSMAYLIAMRAKQ